MAKKPLRSALEKRPVAKQQEVLGVRVLTIKHNIARQLPVNHDTDRTLIQIGANPEIIVGWVNAREGLGWTYTGKALIVRVGERLEVWDVGMEWFRRQEEARARIPQILID
jgi:hypothetical protein